MRKWKNGREISKRVRVSQQGIDPLSSGKRKDGKTERPTTITSKLNSGVSRLEIMIIGDDVTYKMGGKGIVPPRMKI